MEGEYRVETVEYPSQLTYVFRARALSRHPVQQMSEDLDEVAYFDMSPAHRGSRVFPPDYVRHERVYDRVLGFLVREEPVGNVSDAFDFGHELLVLVPELESYPGRFRVQVALLLPVPERAERVQDDYRIYYLLQNCARYGREEPCCGRQHRCYRKAHADGDAFERYRPRPPGYAHGFYQAVELF